MMQEQDLDLSILRVDLGWEGIEGQNRGFWRTQTFNPDMSLVVRNLPKVVHEQKPVCIDYLVFVKRIAELHDMDLDSLAPAHHMDRPIEVDDQVVECTPQFILRNIPKIEHYYDLDRPLNFDIADMPRIEAEDQINEVRAAHVGDIEFIPVEGTNFINDFRAFLEEIFVLCPWDKITRQEPTPDNPWHISNSTSKLALDLIARKNTLFIFSERGMTKMGMKEYKPRAEKKTSQEERPSGFHSYGPG